MRSKVLLISPYRSMSCDPAFPTGQAHVGAGLECAGHTTRLLYALADSEPLVAALREFRPDCGGISRRNIDDVLIRKMATCFDSPTTICETVGRVHSCPVVGAIGFTCAVPTS